MDFIKFAILMLIITVSTFTFVLYKEVITPPKCVLKADFETFRIDTLKDFEKVYKRIEKRK